jgi:hypothetical protein
VEPNSSKTATREQWSTEAKNVLFLKDICTFFRDATVNTIFKHSPPFHSCDLLLLKAFDFYEMLTILSAAIKFNAMQYCSFVVRARDIFMNLTIAKNKNWTCNLATHLSEFSSVSFATLATQQLN